MFLFPARSIHAYASHPQPFARAHFSTSSCPLSAAYAQVVASQSQPFARAHFNNWGPRKRGTSEEIITFGSFLFWLVFWYIIAFWNQASWEKSPHEYFVPKLHHLKPRFGYFLAKTEHPFWEKKVAAMRKSRLRRQVRSRKESHNVLLSDVGKYQRLRRSISTAWSR